MRHRLEYPITPDPATSVLDDAARHAYRQGLFVLAQSGDAVVIRNDAWFQPREW